MTDLMAAALLSNYKFLDRIPVQYSSNISHPHPLTAQPPVQAELPRGDLKVLEHLAGSSVVRLDNGDVVRFHLYIHEMKFDEAAGTYLPLFRVVPQVELSGRGAQSDRPDARPS